jgi:hypothetical protein
MVGSSADASVVVVTVSVAQSSTPSSGVVSTHSGTVTTGLELLLELPLLVVLVVPQNLYKQQELS